MRSETPGPPRRSAPQPNPKRPRRRNDRGKVEQERRQHQHDRETDAHLIRRSTAVVRRVHKHESEQQRKQQEQQRAQPGIRQTPIDLPPKRDHEALTLDDLPA